MRNVVVGWSGVDDVVGSSGSRGSGSGGSGGCSTLYANLSPPPPSELAVDRDSSPRGRAGEQSTQAIDGR
jgi:hypothetical protein